MKAGHQIEVDAFPDADFVELESAEQVLGDVGDVYRGRREWARFS